MALTRCGVRVGAAAFAVGLALAGPQAGLAVAEGAESEAPGSSAASGGTSRAERAGGAAESPSATRAAARAGERRSGAAAAVAAQAVPVAGEEPGENAVEAADAMPAAEPVPALGQVPLPDPVTEAAPEDLPVPVADRAGPAEAQEAVRTDADVETGTGGMRSAPAVPESVEPVAAPVAWAAPEPSVVVAPAPATSADRPPAPSAFAVPEPPAAGAGPVATIVAAVNAAVVGWFDSTAAWLASLPANPVSDFLSGALLLVRRQLFNQLPTAAPYEFSTSADGQLIGTLGVVDAEGDELTYSLSTAPALGAVEIRPDGTWTYTPGPDFVFGAPESFTVAVGSGGFNILNPFAGPLEVTVPVGLVGSDLDYGWGYIRNLTTRVVTYNGSQQAGKQPAKGYLIQPGEQVRIGYYLPDGPTDPRYSDTISLSAPSVSSPAATDTWTLKAELNPKPFLTFSCGNSSGNAGCATSSSSPRYNDGSKIQIGDAPGVYGYTPDTPGAEDALAKLSQMADKNIDGLKAQWLKAQFRDTPPDDAGWVVKSSSADNPSDNTNSRSFTVTDSTSTTEGSSWKVGGGVKFTPIEKVLELAVNAEYGKNYSSTTAKTFTTTFTQSVPPWSANELLQQPPKLLANGDAVFSVPDLGVTYRFFNMDFMLPSQTKDTPFYEFRTEPLQPKNAVTGAPIANIGFTLRDPRSDFLEPTYTVGTQRQLSLRAYNGIALSQAAFEQRSIWSSSDERVVSVDPSGKLTANAPGTATVTARYDWAIPLGGGNTRRDYVLATVRVTVE